MRSCRTWSLAVFLGAVGCSLGGPSTPFDAVVTAIVGRPFTIVPPNGGPVYFQAPPTLSSAAVVFDSVRTARQSVAQNVAQLQTFYFTARAPGSVIVRFQRSASDAGVIDWVNVP